VLELTSHRKQSIMKLNFNSFSLVCLAAIYQGANAIVTGNIKIVGGMGSGQMIPGSYVNSFSRWTIERTIDQNIAVSHLIGSGVAEPDEEFVNPSSNEELWWPADLENLQVRPSLGIIMKNSIPSYVLAGVEVRVPANISKDGEEWRNFGMNSQPLASQWSDFDIAAEQDFRVEVLYGSKGDDEEEDDSIDWKAIIEGSNDERKSRAHAGTQKALELFTSVLAGMDEQSPLYDGMHILSIPVDKWIDLPPNDAENKPYNIISVGTSVSDVKELLRMGSDMLEISSSSVLNVQVQRIAPGGESEYMPSAYHGLYKEKE
jgi:hypothetical protein